MSGPVLTPRIAADNHWTVYAHCDKCRAMTLLDLKPLVRTSPDRDLGEALVRGRITCQMHEQACVGLSVSRQDGGIVKTVMKLTPGLTVVREEELRPTQST